LGSRITTDPLPSVNVKVFYGTAIVHMLPTEWVNTFNEYGDNVFLPWTKQKLQNCGRIEINMSQTV